LRFYAAQTLFEPRPLSALQALINKWLPAWSLTLSVHDHEDQEAGIAVGRDNSLFLAIDASLRRNARPYRLLRGSYEKLNMFLNSYGCAAPPELNKLALEIYQAESMEGQSPVEWSRNFFEQLNLHLPVRYAHTYFDEEFDAKNIVRDDGVRAVGVKLTKSLPGLYWLNYFGAPYVDLIGKDRLLSAPAHETKEVGTGVLLSLAESGDSWDSPAYVEREQRTIEHIGRQYFFSRKGPDEEKIAPDFSG
jgi:hypothetical protein